MAQEHRDREGAARTLNNLGWLFKAENDPEKALLYFSPALRAFESLSDPANRSAVLYGMAQSRRLLHQFDLAQQDFEAAMDAVEEVRRGLAGDDLGASYFATRHDLYESYVDLLMEQHRSEPGKGFDIRAFNISQRARAREFLDNLNSTDLISAQDLTLPDIPADLERREFLLSEIKAAAKCRSDLIQRDALTDQIAAWAQRERERTTELQLLQRRGWLGSARNKPWSEPLTMTQIQHQALDEDTLLLHYELGNPRSYLWVVSTHNSSVFELPSKDVIEKVAIRCHTLLSQSHKRRYAAAAWQASAELARLVLAPAIPDLSTKRLLVAGEDALLLIPFGALWLDGQLTRAGHPRPLLATHEIVHAPSASVLAQLRRRSPRHTSGLGGIAVFADPVYQRDDPRFAIPPGQPRQQETAKDNGSNEFLRLPHSREEAHAILSLFPPADRRLAIGFDASREAFLDHNFGKVDYLHFAVHGLLHSDRPQLSGLALSMWDPSGRPMQGTLHAQEIAAVALHAKLVVLSGCQTALGKRIEGEGLVGLPRAFFQAGAQTVVVSLWGVRDQATSELMRRFYELVVDEDLKPSAALRAAQLSMLEGPRFKSPSYWASFVLQGDWR